MQLNLIYAGDPCCHSVDKSIQATQYLWWKQSCLYFAVLGSANLQQSRTVAMWQSLSNMLFLAADTPVWRKGDYVPPHNQAVGQPLCNACGTRDRRHHNLAAEKEVQIYKA